MICSLSQVVSITTDSVRRTPLGMSAVRIPGASRNWKRDWGVRLVSALNGAPSGLQTLAKGI